MSSRRRYDPSTPFGQFLDSMFEIGGYGSVNELSRQTGLSSEAFRRWQKGEVVPSERAQIRIAQIFRLTSEQCIEFGMPLAVGQLGSGHELGEAPPAEDKRVRELAANLINRAETGPPLTGVEAELLRDILVIPHNYGDRA